MVRGILRCRKGAWIGPVLDIEIFGNEFPLQQEILEVTERIQLSRIEIESQIAIYVRAIRSENRLLADADLASDETHGLPRIVICPIRNALNRGHQFRYQIRTLIGKSGVHGQGTRRTVIDADLRIRVKTRRYHDLRGDEIGDSDAFRALDEKCIDLAPV